MHKLKNYIEIKAKCRHLKKFTCKGSQAFVCGGLAFLWVLIQFR
jgi:hypothetical protein